MKDKERLLKQTQGQLKAEITTRLEEFATDLNDQADLINDKIDLAFSELLEKLKDQPCARQKNP